VRALACTFCVFFGMCVRAICVFLACVCVCVRALACTFCVFCGMCVRAICVFLACVCVFLACVCVCVCAREGSDECEFSKPEICSHNASVNLHAFLYMYTYVRITMWGLYHTTHGLGQNVLNTNSLPACCLCVFGRHSAALSGAWTNLRTTQSRARWNTHNHVDVRQSWT